jgi:membrane dipeptidase
MGAGLVVAPSVVGAQVGSDSVSRIVVDGLDTSIVNAEFLELLRAGGVDCMHGSLGTVEHYGYFYGFADEHPDEVAVAKSVADIRRAKRDGKISFIFGAQHANHLEQLIDKDPRGTFSPVRFALRGYYELGLRFQGICYNVSNIFGGGNLDPRVPLTRAGRQLVEEIHKLHLILDVGGHTGEQTSLDAIEMSSGVPVVCTHTNVAALVPNIRAISDRLAEAIAATGGVIGVTAISDFQMRSAENYQEHGLTSPQATLDDHLDQYDHFKRLVGTDHIGLGPDFVWGWGETFYHAPDDSITFPPESMGLGVPKLVKGFEDISKLPNLIKGLRGRGWTETELDKLLGANWLRVYERVWGG